MFLTLTCTVAAGIVACSSDAGEQSQNTDDVGLDTSIDSATDVDSGDDADRDVTTGDTDVDDEPPLEAQWSNCDCPAPEEKCTISDFCGLPDEECGPDNDGECPEGYTCQREYASTTHPVFVCICVGDDERCTSTCERQEDCPLNFQSCSYQDGVCRWNAGSTGTCRNTMDCPEGYYCDDEYSRCQPTGDRGVGESCEWDDDCQTGICNQSTGLCDEQCLGDDDCPEDTHCIIFGGDWQGDNGCSEHIDCTVSCTPPERCGGDICVPQACDTTDDCDTGDCQRDLQSPHSRLPTCIEHEDADVDHYCKPDERFSPSGHCYIPSPCWDDTHCDEPYECFFNCRREIDLEGEDSEET